MKARMFSKYITYKWQIITKSTKTKRKNKETYAPKLMKWYCTFQESLTKSGSKKPTYDAKWGRFLPQNRVNVDQVPLHFAVNRKKTSEETPGKELRRYNKVWLVNPGSGLDKRQC